MNRHPASPAPRALAVVLALVTWPGALGCAGQDDVAPAAPARTLADPFVVPGLSVEVAVAGPGAPTRAFRAPAEVRLDATRRATVVARVEGVVGELYAAPGDEVEAGAPLCVLESRELAAARSALLEARQRADFARAALAREERLLARDATSEQEVLAARRAALEAELAISTAAAALRALGVEPDPDDGQAGLDGALQAPAGERAEVADAAAVGAASLARFVVRAPLAGRVLERPVSLGEATTPERVLFELADLDQVWVEARLPVATLAQLSLEDEVRVVARAQGLDLGARLSYVDPRVDPGTQTAVARAVLSTAGPGAALRPGLFVELRGATAALERPVTVPAGAVAAADDGRVVFVRDRSSGADAWIARRVELGAEGDAVVEVRSGLRAGETVAASELLLLKSVWLGQGGEE